MIKLEGIFICSDCGHEEEGVNNTDCPKCGYSEIHLKVSPNEFQILPKVSEMAEQIDTAEAYAKAKFVLRSASYHEASQILREAIELLKIFIKAPEDTSVAKSEDLSLLKVFADQAEKIGKLGSALRIISEEVL